MIRLKQAAKLGCLGLAALAAASAVHAQSGQAISVERFDFVSDKGIMTARTTLDLNQSLRDALEGGTQINFVIGMKLVEDRWVLDRDLASFSWKASINRRQYGLGYEYKHFGVPNWIDVSSVEDALAAMNEFTVEFSDPTLVRSLRDPNNYLALRLEVDLESLPNPLKIDLLTSADWNFSSGWQRIQI